MNEDLMLALYKPQLAPEQPLNPSLLAQLVALTRPSGSRAVTELHQLLLARPDVPGQTLAELAQLHEAQLSSFWLAQVLRHPNCPRAVREKHVSSESMQIVTALLADPDPQIATAAFTTATAPRLRNPKKIIRKLKAISDDALHDMTHNPAIADAQLVGLAERIVELFDDVDPGGADLTRHPEDSDDTLSGVLWQLLARPAVNRYAQTQPRLAQRAVRALILSSSSDQWSAERADLLNSAFEQVVLAPARAAVAAVQPVEAGMAMPEPLARAIMLFDGAPAALREQLFALTPGFDVREAARRSNELAIWLDAQRDKPTLTPEQIIERCALSDDRHELNELVKTIHKATRDDRSSAWLPDALSALLSNPSEHNPATIYTARQLVGYDVQRLLALPLSAEMHAQALLTAADLPALLAASPRAREVEVVLAALRGVKQTANTSLAEREQILSRLPLLLEQLDDAALEQLPLHVAIFLAVHSERVAAALASLSTSIPAEDAALVTPLLVDSPSHDTLAEVRARVLSLTTAAAR